MKRGKEKERKNFFILLMPPTFLFMPIYARRLMAKSAILFVCVDHVMLAYELRQYCYGD